MKYKKSLLISILTVLIVLGACAYAFNDREKVEVLIGSDKLEPSQEEESQLEDITEQTRNYSLHGKSGGEADLLITTRTFPNKDKMIYIEGKSRDYRDTLNISIPFTGTAEQNWTENTPVTELYPYRKERTLEDPLSATLKYMGNGENSLVLGPQVYFKDISYTYPDEKKSRVMEFQREEAAVTFSEDRINLTIKFNPEEEQFSTWFMLADSPLFSGKAEFQQAQKIAVDEFRWMTPDTLWSHGLNSIFPSSENAFVRSLVRQSGRASAVMLENSPSRFWENINRHHFASLEAARGEDGLWHTDYTSTWLEKAYGFGPEYIDSRHNDNIFRSQLRRAELFGFEDYADNRKVYADFLLEMAEKGFVIPQGEGYYLIDYFDGEHKTHTSLNHALSLMNYQFDAYRAFGESKYLESAEKQFAALMHTGEKWIDEEGLVQYQFNLDGSMSGKDYNLVTYYDLLYTEKIREELGYEKSELITELIAAKKKNLLENGLPIEGTATNAEDFIGLIE